MKLAAHMLTYNVDRFMPLSIDSMLPYIDRLYLAHPVRPFAYNPQSREERMNGTDVSFARTGEYAEKVQIIEGDWETEEAARNECLSTALVDGNDWLLTVDADEFYAPDGWEQIRREFERGIKGDHVSTTWYNFFRTPQYIIQERTGSIKSVNATFALRCSQDASFTVKRKTNATSTEVLDVPCYHYGYVMTDAEMLEKITTWSHAADFDVHRWYRLKWLAWREETTNLHPVTPPAWRRAIRFPLWQPDFAHRILDSQVERQSSLAVAAENFMYDVTSVANFTLRKMVRPLFHGWN